MFEKLPISFIASHCAKILERLLFNEMFRFLIENNLVSGQETTVLTNFYV